mmetsp:Transcript_52902/g.129192  ORF Transcript_52902/g.129192 Transcript_52902/m.129192 type:complete len:257 (-) Transcript_52902:53-823(-)
MMGRRACLGAGVPISLLASFAALAALSTRGPAGPRELLDVRELPRLDAEIQRDVRLLKAQQVVVRMAESKMARAAGGAQGAAHSSALSTGRRRQVVRARVPILQGGRLASRQAAALSRSRRQRLSSPRQASGGGEVLSPGEHSYRYEQRHVARHLGDMVRASTLMRDNESFQEKQVEDWDKFFDHLNTEVDVPKYGKKDLLVDNIEAIPPCNQDCDYEGTPNDEAFEWFNTLNTENKDGHIVDNLKDITACVIDCG